MGRLFRHFGKRPFRRQQRERLRRRDLRLEQLEPRVVLAVWLSGSDNLSSMDQGPEALQQRLDDASRLLAAQRSGPAVTSVELPAPRLQQLPTSEVYAIQKAIIAGDPNATPPDSPANRVDPNTPDSRFAGVGSLRVTTATDGFICTATAISPNHVLTAAHCLDVDDNGSIDVEPANVEFNVNLDSATSSTYVIAGNALFVHPDWTGFDNPWVNDDVAVVELASELPADVPIYALNEAPFLDNEIPILVGYGESGTGVDGYTEGSSFLIKRSGQNEAEYYYTDDEGSSAREVFYYDFDAPSSPKSLGNDIETTLGGGDSGGPAFLEDGNGSLVIFGINTFTLQWEDNTPPAPLFGSAGGGMVVYEYIDFISSVVDGEGVFVNQTLGSTEVVEGGATDTYSLVLRGAPSGTVIIDVTGDPQLSVSPSQLTFTSENWSTPQSVLVSAVDDAMIEGPHRGKITHTSTSNDPAYNGNRIDDVRVRIIDDDWSLAETPYVDLGTSDNVAWDQPRVAVEVLTDAAGSGSVGPTIFNTWLLDTGANSTMAFATAVDDMDDLPYIYQTVGKFEEFGVAGPQLFDISAPYRFDFAGSDGERNTLLNTSLLSDADDDISILGPWGIVGMSAMVDRVTTFDFGVWTDIDLFDLYMGLDFSDDVPAGNGYRYSVAVDNRLVWTPEEQIIEGTRSPVWADVPFFSGIVVHNNVAAGGNFLLDSGAQMSVLSTLLAKEIGLDSNNDGALNEFDANFARYEVVGGIGGTVAAPVFLFDEIRVPTQQGPDLLWTDLQWLVLDIADGLDGVFGFDLMTSGWIEAFAVNGKSGYIMQAQLDFRDMGTSGTGVIYIDLNPEASQLIDPNGPGARIIESGGSTTVSEIGVDDTYQMVLTQQPAANVTITLVNTENQLVAVDDAHPSRDYLVFTPTNWNQPQTVRVSAVDDENLEIFHRSSIIHVSSSSDPVYNAVGIRRVIANIIDNDYAGVMIIPSDGATEVVEGGITDTYQLVLTYPPTRDVTLQLEHLQGQVTAVDAANPLRTYLTFDTTNWDVPQTVLVTALEDTIVEGYHETYITHQISTSDINYQETFSVQELVSIRESAGVVDRRIFYNGSKFDGFSGGAAGADDDAVAPDPDELAALSANPNLGKTALLPGQEATFRNYTSYSAGINGIMIDVAGLADPDAITADDFEFRVGNDESPADWALVTAAAQISVRPGEGKNGSDRITIIWPNNAIQNQWLQVTVKATVNTGLGSPDVHYWGNAIGESGNSTVDTFVNASDELGARNNPRGRFNPAALQDACDFNRDAMVNATDELVARNHPAGRFNSLKLFVAPDELSGPVIGQSDTGASTGAEFSTSNSGPSSLSPSSLSPSSLSPSSLSPSSLSPSSLSPSSLSPSSLSPTGLSPTGLNPSSLNPSSLDEDLLRQVGDEHALDEALRQLLDEWTDEWSPALLGLWWV